MRTLSITASLVLCTAVLRAETLLVGPGLPYATLQSAVDAAADGDTIRIAPGTFAGFVVSGKTLTILGSGNDQTNVACSVIGATGVATRLVIHGITFQLTQFGAYLSPGAVAAACGTIGSGPPIPGGWCGAPIELWIVGSETVVDLVDSNVIGKHHALWVLSATVSAHRCIFAGSKVWNCFLFGFNSGIGYGGVGIYGHCANVSLTGCYVVGGEGSGTVNASSGNVGWGGDGIHMEGGAIIAHESSFWGGNCNTTSFSWGTGGDGAHFVGTTGRIAAHGQHALMGGRAGNSGLPVRGGAGVEIYSMYLCVFLLGCNPPIPVPGAPYQTFPLLSLNGAAAVWSSGEVVLDHVPPAAEVALFMHVDTSMQALPLSTGFFGDLLIAPFALPVASGYADATGRFVVPVDFSLVPAAFVEIGLFMQAGVLDPATGLVLASNALGFVIR